MDSEDHEYAYVGVNKAYIEVGFTANVVVLTVCLVRNGAQEPQLPVDDCA